MSTSTPSRGMFATALAGPSTLRGALTILALVLGVWLLNLTGRLSAEMLPPTGFMVLSLLGAFLTRLALILLAVRLMPAAFRLDPWLLAARAERWALPLIGLLSLLFASRTNGILVVAILIPLTLLAWSLELMISFARGFWMPWRKLICIALVIGGMLGSHFWLGHLLYRGGVFPTYTRQLPPLGESIETGPYVLLAAEEANEETRAQLRAHAASRGGHAEFLDEESMETRLRELAGAPATLALALPHWALDEDFYHSLLSLLSAGDYPCPLRTQLGLLPLLPEDLDKPPPEGGGDSALNLPWRTIDRAQNGDSLRAAIILNYRQVTPLLLPVTRKMEAGMRELGISVKRNIHTGTQLTREAAMALCDGLDFLLLVGHGTYRDSAGLPAAVARDLDLRGTVVVNGACGGGNLTDRAGIAVGLWLAGAGGQFGILGSGGIPDTYLSLIPLLDEGLTLGEAWLRTYNRHMSLAVDASLGLVWRRDQAERAARVILIGDPGYRPFPLMTDERRGALPPLNALMVD